MRKENTNVPVLKKNGTNYENSLDKAEILNNQFQSVFTIKPDFLLPDKGPSLHPTLPDITVSLEGVYNLLLDIYIHKAYGPDQIAT